MKNTRMAPELAPREQLLGDVRALAGVRQFLAQTPEAETPGLLLHEVGGLSACVLTPGKDGKPPFIAFALTDGSGETHPCRCDSASYALLLLILVFGQSAFIDRSSQGGKPYLKVFGRNDTSAGTVFARILFGVEAGETVTYHNGNALDLRHENLKAGPRNSRAESGAAEWNSEALFTAPRAPDAVLAGSAAEKVEAAKELLQKVRMRIDAERNRAAARQL